MRKRFITVNIPVTAHALAKAESRRAGLSMGDWLAAAATAYAAQTDPTFAAQCEAIMRAMAGFGEVLSIAPAPPPPPPPPPNYGDNDNQ